MFLFHRLIICLDPPQAFRWSVNPGTTWLQPCWLKTYRSWQSFCLRWFLTSCLRASDRKDVGPIFDIITVRRCFCCNLNGLRDDPGSSWTDWLLRTATCEFVFSGFFVLFWFLWFGFYVCVLFWFFFLFFFFLKYPWKQECLWGCSIFLKLLKSLLYTLIFLVLCLKFGIWKNYFILLEHFHF